MLRDEQRVADGLAHRSRDVVVDVHVLEAPRHVRDVDAPAVEAEVEPPAHDVEHAPAKLRRAPVELRQRLDAPPRRVPVVVAVVEPEEVALRRIGARSGRDEPLVPVAAVVRRDVADDADPAIVRCTQEGRERVVAAEKRVDAIERRRVVAVGAARGEDRRQVDHRRAEVLDVAEVLLDAGKIATEQLDRGGASAPCRELVPLAPDRPLRGVDIEA
jgi:hypothetical protein